jgi:hypothetical protein
MVSECAYDADACVADVARVLIVREKINLNKSCERGISSSRVEIQSSRLDKRSPNQSALMLNGMRSPVERDEQLRTKSPRVMVSEGKFWA